MGARALQIAQVRASHERLHEAIADLDDTAARAPSRLPGWTVGHVLTHLARNADSVVRRLEGAARNELVTQYDGGRDGRNAAIEAGAGRAAAELIADVRATDARVDELFAVATDEVWSRSVLDSGGGVIPASRLVFSRWREVETHHVDLGFGYTSQDWPTGLVEQWLPELIEGLGGRADHRPLMAWLLGRGPAPQLSPWG